MKTSYVDGWRPSAATLADVERAELVCAEYARQGFDLTLRQLYYQFVARGWIANTMQSYKRLGSIINDARMAGLLDWSYIVDRTRNLRGTSHWGTPADIIDASARSFRLDKWADQPYRVEVWIEKEALAGIVARVAATHDVDWFSCRGYVSQSEMHDAGTRLASYISDGQDVVLLHLGDHDPSGIDMTRDIEDRLNTFVGWPNSDRLEVRRIALNIDQVRRYNPPPNPAKLTDSRASSYVTAHGYESWELDALDPATMAALITEHIEDIRDDERWAGQVEAEATHRRLLAEASARWTDVVGMLDS